MARPANARRRAPAVVAWASGAVVIALVAAGAVLAQGYNAEEVPAVETSVWVSRDNGDYARVNTDIAEIESVNKAAGLAGIAQAGSAAFVFGSGWQKYWPIDSANPVDIADETDSAAAAEPGDTAATGDGTQVPDGTTGTLTNGEWCAADSRRPLEERRGRYVLFTGGALAWARSAELEADPTAVHALDPLGGAGGDYQAAAATISACGVVATYSVQDGERQVRTTDAERGRPLAATPIADAPTTTAGLQLTMVGETWVLLAASGDGSRMWIDGRGPFELPDVDGGGLLQAPGPAADEVLVATSTGLERISMRDGAVIGHVDAAGTAARPAAFGGRMAAAWLGTGSGELWTSGADATVDLAIDGGEFPQNTEITPELVTNGDRAVLLEQATGMLWSVPDGRLIPLAQWSSDTPPKQGTVDVPDASQEEPPVAVDDAFGVRAGGTAVLPVLFDDHDANADDVLTIDPASIRGLDPAFGTLDLVGGNQTLVVHASGGAPSASFTYQASDGMATSAPATVTLTLRTDDTAPQWCGDYFQPNACHVDWPSPQLGIGGTATFDVLKGWVDPEGDAMIIDSAVTDPSAPITAMPTADGRLAIAHDRNGAAGDYTVMVTVVDALGARSAPKELDVRVVDPPDFTFHGGALVGRAGETTQASITDYASGGSGSYHVTDVTDVSPTLGRLAKPDWNEAAGTVLLTAEEPGEYIVTVKAQDAVTRNEHTANLRYTVLPADGGGVAIPPLTAYVRQGEDTLVDVLGAVQNTTGSVLLVTSAIPGPSQEGVVAIAAAVIDNATVQLRSLDTVVADRLGGRTDGPLGTVALTLADPAGTQYTGTISVFLVPASGQAPVAIPDTATVRAGDVVGIDVLANDVAPRGERLALSPDVSASGDAAGLAFSSGRTLRYVAPDVPGTYTVFYYAYLESAPSLTSRSQVTITVLPPGANRAPQAKDLQARTLTGRSIAIEVPVDAMDPDGDRVTVTGVTQPADDTPGSVMVGEDGKSLRFYAPEVNKQQREDAGPLAAGWQSVFTYTVRDAAGQTDTATVRVAVSTEDPTDLAPVVFADHVRVKRPTGAAVPITVEPLRNDRDPADAEIAIGTQDGGAGLHLLGAVLPNMSGLGTDGTIAPGTPADAASRLLDPVAPTTAADGSQDYYPDGQVRFRVSADTPPGTYTYLYTAESLTTRSTAQGVIVITVSDGDEPDRPTIDDTVVDIRTRAQLESGGIDVLTGKVSWPTGDATRLAATLALAPGAPSGFTANPDGRIEGRIPAAGAVVPFSVTGVDLAGEPFTAYGLLRIPAFDDLRLQVVALPDPVQETKSGDIDLTKVLGIADGDRIEVNPASSFAVHRPSTDPKYTASCALKGGSGSTLVYTAGYSPGIGSDTCTIDARLGGQSDDAWSTIVIPIPITPLDPLAILTPITKTIPFVDGETVIDLTSELVTWTGGFAMPEDRVDTMTFTAPYAGGAFKVVATGDPWDLRLDVNVLPTTPGGTREVIPVTLTYPWPNSPQSAPYSKTVNIVLYSGQPPPGGPVGASVQLRCNAAAPDGCATQVVFPTDQSGQYNPSAANTSGASTALTLAGVGGGTGSATCAGLGTVTAEGTTARLVLAQADEGKPPGGTCTVPFTVRDTLGRTGQGTISIEVEGYSPRPQKPVTNSVGEDWVRVDVVLGAAANAHPAVTGVRLYEQGALVPNQSCAPLDAGAYQCLVSGLAIGEHHFFAARAVNSFGGGEQESAITEALETWAFASPEFPAGGAPVYDDEQYVDGTTTRTRGVVLVHRACLDNNAADASRASTIELSVSSGTVTPSELTTDASGCVAPDTPLTITAVGPISITATPVSGVQPPMIGTVQGGNSGGADVQAITSRGTPALAGLAVSAVQSSSTGVTVSVDADANYGAGTPQIVFLAWKAGDAAPTCTKADGAFPGSGMAVNAGAAAMKSGTATSATFAFGADITVNEKYDFMACATWDYGMADPVEVDDRILFRQPAAPSSSDMTYTPASHDMDANYAGMTGTATAPVFTWDLTSAPDPTNNAEPGFALPADPPPSGASPWEIRYAFGTATPAASAFTHPAITNALIAAPNAYLNAYAKYCFTWSGTDYCSNPSAAIRSDTAFPGIAMGSSGSVRLPTQAQCAAFVDGLNAQVTAAGQAAYDAAWGSASSTPWAEDPSSFTGGSLFDKAYYLGYRGATDHPGYNATYAGFDQGAAAAAYEPGYEAANLASPTWTAKVQEWYDTHPEAGPMPAGPADYDPAAVAYANAWAHDQAVADANAQAQSDAQAAADAAGRDAVQAIDGDRAAIDGGTIPVDHSGNAMAAETPAQRRDGAQDAAIANLRSSSLGSAPGLSGLPAINAASIARSLNDAGHVFTTVAYDFTNAAANSPFSYVPGKIRDYFAASANIYTCG